MMSLTPLGLERENASKTIELVNTITASATPTSRGCWVYTVGGVSGAQR